MQPREVVVLLKMQERCIRRLPWIRKIITYPLSSTWGVCLRLLVVKHDHEVGWRDLGSFSRVAHGIKRRSLLCMLD